MPMPKRETVMTNFKTQLKTITIANEYSFDANVYDWREAPVDKSECPAIICRDTVETIIVAIGTHLHNLCVQMELISMEGTTPVSIRQMIADVVYCLGQNLNLCSFLVDESGNLLVDENGNRILVAGTEVTEDILPVEGEDIVIEQKENKIGSVIMSVIVQYLTEPFNPYQ